MNYITRIIIWVILFAIAMGLLEAAVVVYLRELYYPSSSELFPMKDMLNLAPVELAREAATLFMLAAVGVLAGKNKWSRWAYFILAFGIWDIFYYVFLKVFMNWPDTIVDWDILFLIPLPWFGPVLAPVLIAMLMTIWGIYVAKHENKGRLLALKKLEWGLLFPGLAIALLAFLWDSIFLLFSGKVGAGAFANIGALAGFKPETFVWWVFIPGLLLQIAAFGFYVKRIGSCSDPSH